MMLPFAPRQIEAILRHARMVEAEEAKARRAGVYFPPVRLALKHELRDLGLWQLLHPPSAHARKLAARRARHGHGRGRRHGERRGVRAKRH
jgi:hypothetical protein